MISLNIEDIKKRYKDRRIGFKATESDMKCRGYTYSLGTTHKHEGSIYLCFSGFHLCRELISVFNYYPNLSGTIRFFIVEYGNNFLENGDKIVTNELTLLEEFDPMDFITQNLDSFEHSDWTIISTSQKLSEDFIRQHKDKLDWYYISMYQQISEDLIRENKERVNWILISEYQKLSEDFIREFQDKVFWMDISEYQKLSESFIREFKDKVDWGRVSTFQTLSENFIREFQDRVDWEKIGYNQENISQDLKEEFKHKIDWKMIDSCNDLYGILRFIS